jgi:hypothetical protein
MRGGCAASRRWLGAGDLRHKVFHALPLAFTGEGRFDSVFKHETGREVFKL